MGKSNKFLVGVVGGAIVGTVAGLILAPKPGKDTRAIVADKTNHLKDRAEYYIENLRERFNKEPVEDSVEERSENGTHN